MELVTSLPADTPLSEVAPRIHRIEALGFDTVHISETLRDPFSICALAIEHSTTLTVRTSMVVAFPRSPMLTAYAAWDLARFSAGRFQLGIASQVRGNIVGRYSTPWTDPVAQLGDYAAALRAIFTAFQHGTPLDYHGTHYEFTRLQPYFNPGPLDVPAPAIWMGGVGPRMCTLAGAVADGFVAHPTGSHPVSLTGQVLPALRTGAERTGRTDGGPRIIVVPKVITGPNASAVATARETLRSELAFLYSTPAYRGTLDQLGFAKTADDLSASAQAGAWETLPGLLSDELLNALVPQGTYAELPAILDSWYSGLCDGISLDLPPTQDADPEFRVMLSVVRGMYPGPS
ncbi:TIGR03617 family F420-dependent LLM class oxidoreductase [Nocardia sp. SYP-A9097]|uniref:TIGR03617 family F420-dependent LLM class oxidoreductase n=1 Tax=Nocardia sp. SYP-A9097 TaxID=2663237 RepID=UPI00129B8C91|nr:TIGR03617 family F420-dependent LLM class oxidoreductase [Nocardia sp. SYP-A9097]MRH86977.1 TIGR03617 family F420-dependent LLM class oxidoreductase [Nocardia sp. SYP-A9097]